MLNFTIVNLPKLITNAVHRAQFHHFRLKFTIPKMQNKFKDLPSVELRNPVDPTEPNELVKTHIS
jgi:hypothetical protein